MRYVIHIYEDDSIFAYETSDDGWHRLKVFEGKRPEPSQRIETFAELVADDDEVGIQRLKLAFAKLQDIVHQELGVEVSP